MIKKAFLFLGVILSIHLFADDDFNLDQEVKTVNQEIKDLKTVLKSKQKNAVVLFEKNAKTQEYKALLVEMNQIREKIHSLEDTFREKFIDDAMKTDEGYAFWDQAESNISQLILEYGSQDYLYVIPPELANLKINLFSTIPIAKNSWEDMLKLILTHNGIGVKKINPYLRQLYIVKHDPCNVEAIISRAEDLALIDDGSNICYVFSPKPEQLMAVQNFFERFSDLKQTSVAAIKTNILVFGSKETIIRLNNLYDAVFTNNDGKIVKVITLTKIVPLEAEKIITAFFSQAQKTRPSFYQGALDEISVISQGNSLVLIGSDVLVDRAEKVIDDLEKQLDDPEEMVVFWYTCKHSDPNEISDVLSKIYRSMSNAKIEDIKKTQEVISSNQSNLPVQPKPVQPKKITTVKEKEISFSDGNFVVDAKTGSILMVIKKEDVSKIKDILSKLDVAKKMVELDVLLVERTIQDRKQTGINLLKIGSASNKKETAINFDATSSSKRKGLLDFILSKGKSKLLPAFDLTLSFLMAQDDMKIADCPSILAINQTPATISIVNEISINNGAVQVNSKSGSKFEKSFSRDQFGTTISMIPTIHLADTEDEDSKDFVTLQTDISFDTTKSSDNDRPNVTRRHIENEVRVADGETIILGGLRRKINEEGSEKIPFLGEIPGIGKLFGSTKLSNSTSEMFIFITPHIVKDPKKSLSEKRQNFLQKRSGDTDEFLEKLENAKKAEKKKLFENSLKLFFE
ncbi:MAG: putative type II secretion system protein D [Candidatus Anoxychlamydiales bacterium]|nr:putative type II secretion system protein D [Candidatus Anoxychlamydiales bacterium]